MIGSRPIYLVIDVWFDTVSSASCVEAGANVLVAGSAVFKGGSVQKPAVYGENISAIRNTFEV